MTTNHKIPITCTYSSTCTSLVHIYSSNKKINKQCHIHTTYNTKNEIITHCSILYFCLLNLILLFTSQFEENYNKQQIKYIAGNINRALFSCSQFNNNCTNGVLYKNPTHIINYIHSNCLNRKPGSRSLLIFVIDTYGWISVRTNIMNI